jgi:hypothetical protein
MLNLSVKQLELPTTIGYTWTAKKVLQEQRLQKGNSVQTPSPNHQIADFLPEKNLNKLQKNAFSKETNRDLLLLSTTTEGHI